jgi:hypothetical protein
MLVDIMVVSWWFTTGILLISNTRFNQSLIRVLTIVRSLIIRLPLGYWVGVLVRRPEVVIVYTLMVSSFSRYSSPYSKRWRMHRLKLTIQLLYLVTNVQSHKS